MFFSNNSSSNTKNGHDPFCNLPHLDHSFHLPISFFPFPSPFEVDEEYDHTLNFTTNSSSSSQNDHTNPPIISTNNNSTTTAPSLDRIVLPTNSSDQKNKKLMKKISPRKRLSKKDRHSKITTARGVRDRRMRLSLPVAQQFFGLQDLLGVDKGSKTVEWLLIQAKPEILKLARERSSSNHFIISNNINAAASSNYSANYSNSSELDEVGVIVGDQNLNTKNIKKKKKKTRANKQLPIRKTMDKELREKARERARARTLEKKNQIFIRGSCAGHPNFSKIISSSSWSSPFETTTGGEESAGTQSYNNNSNLNLAIEVEKPITSSQFDYQFHQNFSSFDIVLPKWSPSDDSTFNFLHQQHEFEDSDIFG